MPLSPLKPKTQIENLAQIKTHGSTNPILKSTHRPIFESKSKSHFQTTNLDHQIPTTQMEI